MKTLDAHNPQIAADVIARSYLELKFPELEKTQKSAYEKALALSQADDSALCKKLGEQELAEYSALVVSFRTALGRVTDMKKEIGDGIFGFKTAIPFVANLVAWHQTLGVFRTLKG